LLGGWFSDSIPFVVIYYLAQVVIIFGNLMTYAIIGRILFSWFSMGSYGRPTNRFAQILNDITDPVMNLVKKIPHTVGMLDLSPMIALIGIDLITQLVVFLLSKIA